MMSKSFLMKEAKINHYKPEILEKVYHLLNSLDQLMSVDFLRNRLVLKGGTALNLFYFDDVPRLSVDIDLNYIGHVDRESMLREKPLINDAVNKIFSQKQFEMDRGPKHHAGGKNIWRYNSVLGQKGNLEIDLNYMYRRPLWPIKWLESKIRFDKHISAPILDFHELAAGKLVALFSRTASRDLFDAHHLLTKCKFDKEKLRLSFVTYLAMSNLEFSNLNSSSISYRSMEVRNLLFPVLKQAELPWNPKALTNWANSILEELQQSLSMIVPLKMEEIEFITQLRKFGEIKPELFINDTNLVDCISSHPAILWIKQNAKS